MAHFQRERPRVRGTLTMRIYTGHETDSAHRRYVITQAATKAAALAAMADVVERARNG